MCSNYRPVTRMDRMLTFFGVERARDETPADVYPTQLAPFIRLTDEGTEGGKLAMIADDGHFGLMPGWAPRLEYGRRTYNARSETVAVKPSFREAWRKGYRCIIPAEYFYEPCWETGKSVRWRIGLPFDVPMGIAGIYWPGKDEQGNRRYSFAMLTVNADDHPVMQRFHRPGDEKRMVVILDPKEYMPWLSCPVDEAPRFFRQWMGPLDAYPAPTQPRTRKAKPEPDLGDLLGESTIRAMAPGARRASRSRPS